MKKRGRGFLAVLLVVVAIFSIATISSVPIKITPTNSSSLPGFIKITPTNSSHLEPNNTNSSTNSSTKVYDFVSENSIKAYQCRLGPFPTQFPSVISAQICNREFIDITHESALDGPEGNAYGGVSWTNYATHHFFVLRNASAAGLIGFKIEYVVFDKSQVPSETHYLYVRNFNSSQWELLSSVAAPYAHQGFIYYNSTPSHIMNNYVNSSSKEMWFMGTEGALNGKAASSDYFKAVLTYG